MNYDELVELDSKYKKFKKIKDVSFPIAIVLGVLSFITSIIIYSKTNNVLSFLIWIVLLWSIIYCLIIQSTCKKKYDEVRINLEEHVKSLYELSSWKYTREYDDFIIAKSRQGVDTYNDIKYYKEYPYLLGKSLDILIKKHEYANDLKSFLLIEKYKTISSYDLLEEKILENLVNTKYYKVLVRYTSPAGRSQYEKAINLTEQRIQALIADKSLLMSKTEYAKFLKDKEKELLQQKQQDYYNLVNGIIDYAREQKANLIISDDLEKIDNVYDKLIASAFCPIKKIKSSDDEQWKFVGKVIDDIKSDLDEIIKRNKRILDYYNSFEFKKVKEACNKLMITQKEFNEYIEEKVKSISSLFGKRAVRNETNIEDDYNYIHPYKKSISPFSVELSSGVFASAENNPLDYVIKYFYPDKELYPEQIQKLQLLIEELETLKDAKQIIDNYKQEIKGFLIEVPTYVMVYDEKGFYSRLGFAIIDEKDLNVNYQFSYTSDAGHSKRTFTVEMNEENIISIINILQSKLTMSYFTKEQRLLMTKKLRDHIKERDNYTCKICGNSTHNEPNLLLEIDHIIPVSKGGCTVEENLQTLCWKCNRQKSSKIIN